MERCWVRRQWRRILRRIHYETTYFIKKPIHATTKRSTDVYNIEGSIDSDVVKFEVGQTYTLSATWTCSGQNNGQILFAYIGSTTKVIEPYLGTSGSSVTCTITEKPAETDKLYLLFYANFTGTCNVGDYITYSNVQVEYGAGATAYEPYIGSPSTKAPVEIESVGEKTKNILNIHQVNANVIGKSNCNYTVKDNTLMLDPIDDKLTRVTFPITLEKNTDYVVSGTYEMFNSSEYVGQSSIFVREGKDGGTTIRAINFTVTDGEQNVLMRFNSGNYTNIYFWFYYNSKNDGEQKNGSSYAVYKNIQLEKGTTATEYEPYGYKLDITTRGKNLFNNKVDPVYRNVTSKTVVQPTSTGIKFTEQEIPSGSAFRAMVYPIDKVETIGDRTIYFSTEVIREGFTKTDGTKLRSTIILGYCDYDGSNRVQAKSLSYTDSGLYNMSVTIDSKTYAGKYACVWLYSVATDNTEDIPAGSSVEYTNLMISIGEEEYEPYIGNKTYTIYLDEPLRKVGDVADYIEIKDGVAKVVRNVYEYIVTGDETYTLCDTNAIKTQNGIIPNIKTYYSQSGLFLGYICSHNIFKQASFDYLTTYSASNPTTLEFRKIVENWGLAEYTVDAWVAFVKEELEKGTPITIQYILATPTEETILLDDMFTLAGDAIYEFNTEIAPSDYYFS